MLRALQVVTSTVLGERGGGEVHKRPRCSVLRNAQMTENLNVSNSFALFVLYAIAAMHKLDSLFVKLWIT